MIKTEENNKMNATITVGTKVWGPKRSYMGTVIEIKPVNMGVVFAKIGNDCKFGLYNEYTENIERLEIR